MPPLKVLLVEDDEDDYVFTRDLLAEIGAGRFEVDWCQTYETGLDHLIEGSADVCLLDFRLGARTGLELLRDARSQRSNIPIILMTGLSDAEVDLEAMRSGAADYLVKGEIKASLLERSIRYALQQRRAEEERIRLVREQEARLQAEAANQAKDQFLAMVSHELRTPLSAVLGWVSLLGTGKLDPEARERALKIIERNAKAQAQIIDDLLDIARIVNGTLRLQPREVDLAQVVEKAVEAIHPQAESRSIRILSELDHPLQMVQGDSDRLLQVVSNLLSNAVKFTPEGGTVEIRLRREGELARLTVKDSGRGISPEFLPQVFERFRQAPESEGARQGGLGLGLAIVRHLVERHGGTIAAESPGEGLGATFTVILPLTERALPTAA